ncbi:MAG: hypothetical protein OES12_10065 [Anaerolineae bacterium]|nr:hypothetical protein [Anaerolineae bacterium]
MWPKLFFTKFEANRLAERYLDGWQKLVPLAGAVIVTRPGRGVLAKGLVPRLPV